MFSGELSTPNLWSVQDSSPGTLQTFWESGKVENSPKIAGESEGLPRIVTFLKENISFTIMEKCKFLKHVEVYLHQNVQVPFQINKKSQQKREKGLVFTVDTFFILLVYMHSKCPHK